MSEAIVNDSETTEAAQQFLKEIEKLCCDSSVEYMDAVLHYCEKNDVEIDVIAKYIRKNMVLMAKIQEEAEELNYLQKTSRLPI